MRRGFAACVIAAGLVTLFAQRAALAAPAEREVVLRAADGVAVHAWYRAVKAGAPLVVLFHQAGSSHHEYDRIAPTLNALGYGTLAVDQRVGGLMYGPNVTAAAVNAGDDYVRALPDLRAAIGWAAARHPRALIAWGSSYSAGLVFDVAAHDRRVDAVVAFSPGEYFDDKHFVRRAASALTIPIFADSAATPAEIRSAREILSASPSTRKVQYVPVDGIHGSSTLLVSRNPRGAAANLRAVTAFLKRYAGTSIATYDFRARIAHAVDAAVKPLMAKDGIPGMAVAVTLGGRSWVFDYGVASRETRRPVTAGTLFEIASITKTLTATLASYAQRRGRLSLSDTTQTFLPALHGTAFGSVSLLALGTHTPGGLPLQVPDGVGDDDQLIAYFRTWHPAYAPETYRTYSNVGIGMLGLIAAKSMGGDFEALMDRQLFPALGMRNTFIDLPATRAPDYAQGYTGKDVPIRMAPGELSAEAYGVRTTASDMIRFVAANMDEIELDSQVQAAIDATHIGYFTAGPMTQDLIWEQYPYPVKLPTLLAGNSPATIYDATPVTRIEPPQAPLPSAWLNKTGSTNGFGAYVAFVPAKRMGIVILANKSYGIAERVTSAYTILTALGARQ